MRHIFYAVLILTPFAHGLCAEETPALLDLGRASIAVKGLIGHNVSAVFSPDVKKIVTIINNPKARNTIWFEEVSEEANIDDYSARIWEVESGKELQKFSGHTGHLETAAFSPDGKKVVTASYDHTARIWDADSGKEIQKLEHTRGVLFAAFSPDGKKVITVCWETTARVWDIESGKILQHFNGHTRPLRFANFSPDGKKVVTMSDAFEKTARIWDTETGKELQKLKGIDGGIADTWSAAFSPDGEKIVTTGDVARIWDVKTGKELQRLHVDLNERLLIAGDMPTEDNNRLACTSAFFSPDGTKIITDNVDGIIRIWDAESGAVLQKLVNITRSHWCSSVFFLPDGKKIISSGGSPGIYDLERLDPYIRLIIRDF